MPRLSDIEPRIFYGVKQIRVFCVLMIVRMVQFFWQIVKKKREVLVAIRVKGGMVYRMYQGNSNSFTPFFLLIQFRARRIFFILSNISSSFFFPGKFMRATPTIIVKMP